MKHNPHSIIIQSAICDERRKVHFYNQNHESGIVEFSQASEENKQKRMKIADEVECLPLSIMFHGINVTHVNFFVLDVEGAELMVLQSIDWIYTKFDILAIETEKVRRREGYAEEVTSYLLQRGYIKVDNIPGRNSWFKRADFIPSRRPGIAEGCYSGALWATRYRQLNHTQQDMFTHCPAGYFYKDRCQNCEMFKY